MRRLIIVGFATFLIGTTVGVAATSWRIVARGTGSGTYAIAQASASIDKPAAVGLRVVGGTHEVTWSMACSGQIKRALPDRIYTLGVGNSGDCQVSLFGSASGRASVQILARRR